MELFFWDVRSRALERSSGKGVEATIHQELQLPTYSRILGAAKWVPAMPIVYCTPGTELKELFEGMAEFSGTFVLASNLSRGTHLTLAYIALPTPALRNDLEVNDELSVEDFLNIRLARGALVFRFSDWEDPAYARRIY